MHCIKTTVGDNGNQKIDCGPVLITDAIEEIIVFIVAHAESSMLVKRTYTDTYVHLHAASSDDEPIFGFRYRVLQDDEPFLSFLRTLFGNLIAYRQERAIDSEKITWKRVELGLIDVLEHGFCSAEDVRRIRDIFENIRILRSDRPAAGSGEYALDLRPLPIAV